jgi:hypothetical protein
MSSRWLFSFVLFLPTSLAHADGAVDNLSEKVRPIPPKGVALAEADRSTVKSGNHQPSR